MKQIDHVDITDTGLRITHADGSTVEYSAYDAFRLQHEIRLPQNYEKLFYAMRRAERKKEQQRRKENVS